MKHPLNLCGQRPSRSLKGKHKNETPAEFAHSADTIRIDEISASFTGPALPDAVKATLTIIKIVPEKK
jgi:hypothetical protein